MPFEAAVEDDKVNEIEATRVRNKFILDIVRYVALGLAILSLIMFVIRPMVQRLSSKPEDLDLLMGMPATIGELEEEELEVPTERESGIPPREKILEIAKQDPHSSIPGYANDDKVNSVFRFCGAVKKTFFHFSLNPEYQILNPK